MKALVGLPALAWVIHSMVAHGFGRSGGFVCNEGGVLVLAFYTLALWAALAYRNSIRRKLAQSEAEIGARGGR